MIAMLTSKDVTLFLKEAAEIFPTINRKPTNNNITTIIKTLAPIIIVIKYDPTENTHKLWGVITADRAYNSEYGVSLATPYKLALTEKTIATDANEATIQDVVAEHAAQRNDRALYDAASKGCAPFIKDAMNDVWFK